MSAHAYRLYLLSPLMISLGVAAMRVRFDGDDRQPLHRYQRALWEAEQAAKAEPLPAPSPVPLLRWTCRPADADPAWTVADLHEDWPVRGYVLGGARYHPITGRSSRGRATFHGRLWNPRAQEEAFSTWATERDRPKNERDVLLHDALFAHRKAVAARLGGALYQRLEYPYGTVHLLQRFSSEWLAAQSVSRTYAQLQWLCIEEWARGNFCTMDDEIYRTCYRPVTP